MKGLFEVKELVDENNHYNHKVSVPQYEPSKKKPLLDELCNYSKYGKLIKAINESSVTEDEKKFLKMAASRHIVFNYAKIADYYAHSDKEMQELMEQSALVILDFDDAIANGYIKLSDRLKKAMENSGEFANEK